MITADVSSVLNWQFSILLKPTDRSVTNALLKVQ